MYKKDTNATMKGIQKVKNMSPGNNGNYESISWNKILHGWRQSGRAIPKSSINERLYGNANTRRPITLLTMKSFFFFFFQTLLCYRKLVFISRENQIYNFSSFTFFLNHISNNFQTLNTKQKKKSFNFAFNS